MSDTTLLPVDCGLAIGLEEQSAGAANLQRFGHRAAESHLGWLFLPFQRRFTQYDPGEVLRQCYFWKPERVENQLCALAQLKCLPHDGVKRYVGADVENGHVLHEAPIGNFDGF